MSHTTDVVRMIRALRSRPHTAHELAVALDLDLRKVHRLLVDLASVGAPLRETAGERVTATAKRAPRAYALTVDGLREWLG